MRGDVGLDHARDDVDARTLRGDDAVNARSSGHLCMRAIAISTSTARPASGPPTHR
jgi:hypothetical protein